MKCLLFKCHDSKLSTADYVSETSAIKNLGYGIFFSVCNGCLGIYAETERECKLIARLLKLSTYKITEVEF